ncbi:HSP20-like chaperone [Tanacetum coccineum]
MSRHPTLKWAQRADVIFITIDLPDAKDVKLQLELEGKFYFSATAGTDNVPYEIDVNLHDKVDVNNRILKQEGKTPAFVKVDWDKWVDEDEQEEKADMDFDDIDFSLDSNARLEVDQDKSLGNLVLWPANRRHKKVLGKCLGSLNLNDKEGLKDKEELKSYDKSIVRFWNSIFSRVGIQRLYWDIREVGLASGRAC